MYFCCNHERKLGFLITTQWHVIFSHLNVAGYEYEQTHDNLLRTNNKFKKNYLTLPTFTQELLP